MWISKKKYNRELLKLKTDAIIEQMKEETEHQQWKDIEKLKKDVKKLKKIVKEGY